ncbi:MAG: phosphate ABC transporter permease subunit PstC, partial [Cycloclasticus sp.]|nr:phosphate ABC transporter permease subunit PstC [Cycloclasticus sp.]
METLFKKLTQLSASLLFVILAATTAVLYLSAKPAIEEFGAGFLFESRWGVEEQVTMDGDMPIGVTESGVELSDDDFIDDDDDDFISDDDSEAGSGSREIYGALVPIVGTIFSTMIAMLFSIPIA